MAYMGVNSAAPFIDRTVRAKSSPRVHVNTLVTFDNPWRAGTPLDGTVAKQDHIGKDGSLRYTVVTPPRPASARRQVANLRAAQLHVHAPVDQGDHPYLVDPAPRLRSALALREYLQWRDEG
eukprot:CAMPEP_0178396130 /NCGR_PEP_ID=MMETSP0689_2-20121128/13573_1 /TAXON_ID=160604 /ORGANISM="Amphidinium massartii, Strain CS-259" /LENGTH=121 /DNA_ID=CAMNT_0020016801 /DNA_START=25 /DNA_END=386 /DNA_ORIENTATION=+